MTYSPTIGLEVHAELKTRTKMFCDSLNDPDEERPNVNICPVCMGFPGTLPVVNKEAVRHVLRMGAAINGKLADYTEFDRKNYFYPDLPKGYQISQYEFPLVSGGTLNGVSITRIHLEEDAARNQHGAEEGYSFVDFNRAGLPLMELVTEPCIHDAKTASAFAEELQRLLRYLDAGEANMEKGQMRVEANISISKDSALGTKVEVKNLNSFKSVEKAIHYEIKRQEEVLKKGDAVVQETRGWDEVREVTYSQRLKEGSHDYRYFPDPDIPKFNLSRIAEFASEIIVKTLPELPWQKRVRYLSLGLKVEDVENLVADGLYSAFFDSEVLKRTSEKKTILIGANYLLSDLRGLGAGASELKNLSDGVFAELILLIQRGEISSRGAKDLLAVLLKQPESPRALAEREGLLQVHDLGTLETIASEVILEHKAVVKEVKAGKGEAMKFLIGQGMKKSKGSANPSKLERILREKITAF